MSLEKKIIEVLKSCHDPEIPLDLWSLGLIYNINISDRKDSGHDINITMSLTTPGCSMGQYMADDIKGKVSKLEEVNQVHVAITFDPPWNPDLMTDEAREKLGFGSVSQSTKTQKIETEWE